ncbi:MAG: hypothetical protein SF028_01455 [Candidatus Sumerlaeia bacterium]|nr:hypothetical protein [Candidatus Sumerlaeia bacterium]
MSPVPANSESRLGPFAATIWCRLDSKSDFRMVSSSPKTGDLTPALLEEAGTLAVELVGEAPPDSPCEGAMGHTRSRSDSGYFHVMLLRRSGGFDQPLRIVVTLPEEQYALAGYNPYELRQANLFAFANMVVEAGIPAPCEDARGVLLEGRYLPKGTKPDHLTHIQPAIGPLLQLDDLVVHAKQSQPELPLLVETLFWCLPATLRRDFDFVSLSHADRRLLQRRSPVIAFHLSPKGIVWDPGEIELEVDAYESGVQEIMGRKRAALATLATSRETDPGDRLRSSDDVLLVTPAPVPRAGDDQEARKRFGELNDKMETISGRFSEVEERLDQLANQIMSLPAPSSVNVTLDDVRRIVQGQLARGSSNSTEQISELAERLDGLADLMHNRLGMLESRVEGLNLGGADTPLPTVGADEETRAALEELRSELPPLREELDTLREGLRIEIEAAQEEGIRGQQQALGVSGAVDKMRAELEARMKGIDAALAAVGAEVKALPEQFQRPEDQLAEERQLRESLLEEMRANSERIEQVKRAADEAVAQFRRSVDDRIGAMEGRVAEVTAAPPPPPPSKMPLALSAIALIAAVAAVVMATSGGPEPGAGGPAVDTEALQAGVLTQSRADIAALRNSLTSQLQTAGEANTRALQELDAKLAAAQSALEQRIAESARQARSAAGGLTPEDARKLAEVADQRLPALEATVAALGRQRPAAGGAGTGAASSTQVADEVRRAIDNAIAQGQLVSARDFQGTQDVLKRMLSTRTRGEWDTASGAAAPLVVRWDPTLDGKLRVRVSGGRWTVTDPPANGRAGWTATNQATGDGGDLLIGYGGDATQTASYRVTLRGQGTATAPAAQNKTLQIDVYAAPRGWGLESPLGLLDVKLTEGP